MPKRRLQKGVQRRKSDGRVPQTKIVLIEGIVEIEDGYSVTVDDLLNNRVLTRVFSESVTDKSRTHAELTLLEAANSNLAFAECITGPVTIRQAKGDGAWWNITKSTVELESVQESDLCCTFNGYKDTQHDNMSYGSMPSNSVGYNLDCINNRSNHTSAYFRPDGSYPLPGNYGVNFG